MITFINNAWSKYKASRERKLFPEREHIVEITDDLVSCKRPDGTTEVVEINKLTKVEIQTIDLGPFTEDVFWVLFEKESKCIIPQGATNQEVLLDRLQSLPNFDNEIFMDAMRCTDNNQFTVWKNN